MRGLVRSSNQNRRNVSRCEAAVFPVMDVRVLVAGGVLLALAAGWSFAAAAEPADPVTTEVRVERVKPQKEKHVTLRFLKENVDFIRARFDRLRELPVASRGQGTEIDPRFLAYREMLARIAADQDSLGAAEEARRRRDILASITQLGDLELELDLLQRLLAEQRTRLGVLQDDFTGDQRTALMVVVSGDPGDVALSEIAVTLEDGARLTVPLTPEQRQSLRHGGVVQIFHGFVEPRQQVVEVGITGERWPSGDSGFVTLDPVRDRLTLLELRLTGLDPSRGATSIQASTRLHDPRTASVGG